MKTALLIIDMQKDFFKSEKLQSLQSSLVGNINSLEAIARGKNMPVIWIRQEMKADMSNAPLGDRKEGKPYVVTGTEGAQLVDGLEKQDGDYEIIKTRYSSFYETELEDLLKKLQIDTLILAGINTHACVRVTAIDAYQRDYSVILASECVNSWDEEHHRVSIKYLTGKITRPMTNEEIKLLN